MVEQHTVAEVKSTNGSHHNTLIQTYVGRTAWVLNGRWDSARKMCTGVEVRNTIDNFVEYEREEQEGLQRAAGLLQVLRRTVADTEAQNVMVCVPVMGMELEVRAMRDRFEPLLASMEDRFLR